MTTKSSANRSTSDVARPRVFSGIQPSGMLHLGNYVGAISLWTESQAERETILKIDGGRARRVVTGWVLPMRRSNSGSDPRRWIARRKTVVRRHINLVGLVDDRVAASRARRGSRSLIIHLFAPLWSVAATATPCVTRQAEANSVASSGPTTCHAERRLRHHRQSTVRNAAPAASTLAIRASVKAAKCRCDCSEPSLLPLVQHCVQFVSLGLLRVPGIVSRVCSILMLIRHGTQEPREVFLYFRPQFTKLRSSEFCSWHGILHCRRTSGSFGA